MFVEDSGKNHVNFKNSNGVSLGAHTSIIKQFLFKPWSIRC